ncbi:Rhodanese-related sulfurtransferase [Litoreibacter ascidiaceicola]|uniref:Rhodanese-related sulfurtransferase n=1 Tax=Litoreibacter ascidiaceicola TaxID=1486859 RepID=A0A1M4VAM2_9RHOB|nr:rhodanese-like domain-containing protein [Litoreibacter ascidiaceicola]SHE66004.1 Rhodanese-related sulfurtransferase [Litoreibacter ascidiaceicola]
MADLSRRALLTGGAIVLAGGMIYAAGGRNLFYSAITEASEAVHIDPPTAHQQAVAGDILLVDIRRPDEWTRTGSGEGATRLDMRREDFVDALLTLTGGETALPVALICARGVRSARLSNQLAAAGFSNIIDVPEGMQGSRAGPGWLKRGLPVVR